MKQYNEEQLTKLLKDYQRRLKLICFSAPEQKQLATLNGTEDILSIIKMLVDANVELNTIFEICPDSIYVAGEGGMTERANQAFEKTTKIPREKVLNRNVFDLEEEGLFRPSMYRLVEKEQREISCLQDISCTQSGRQGTAIATGVPLFDENGKLKKVITNAIDLNKANDIISYTEQSPGTTGDQEKKIIAESGSMKKIIEITKHIANVDSNVLITGESGVGKGVFARLLHQHSYRRNKVFMQINCGAIPDNLLESELFGYEGGAFTGADKKGKTGLIELADKGTLFLDEIGELPLLLQVKILGFLQERKITRVGGTKEIAVNARVIAATNQDLLKLVSEGKFREDLFYRLNVVPLVIPPLRERRDDIYPAARYFAQYFNEKYHKEFELSDEFLESLLQNEWKGNLRELENYMERMVVMGGVETTASTLTKHRNKIKANNSIMNQKTLDECLEEYEAELIRVAYQNTPNTYKLAETLGISQSSVWRKVKKYIK